MVTDCAVANSPMGVVTGDFLFVGDVGRPDLLEKAARVAGASESSAKAQFASVQRFRSMPDHLQVWPGHGAGSACGKSLGAVPQSTVGYEKLFNWAFQVGDADTFVEMVLAGQPEPPTYFAAMKRINKEGPRILHGLPRPERLPLARLRAKLTEGALVVDTRHAADYAQGHIPGTINIPLNRSFTTWAGWLIPYTKPFYVLIDEASAEGVLDELMHDLASIGLDGVAGYFGSEVVAGWAANGAPLGTVDQITARELAGRRRRGEVAVIDVRGEAEWEAGHLPGVPNIPVGMLADRLDELPRGKPIVLQCQSGARSSIAASVLKARGIPQVMSLTGGFAEWEAAGLPVQRDDITIGAATSASA
jgi:hydroxyacylglutathione hydrolase